MCVKFKLQSSQYNQKSEDKADILILANPHGIKMSNIFVNLLYSSSIKSVLGEYGAVGAELLIDWSVWRGWESLLEQLKCCTHVYQDIYIFWYLFLECAEMVRNHQGRGAANS